MEAELEQLSDTGASHLAELAPGAVPASAAEPRPQSAARLIEYASGRYIAFPPHTTYALIENPVIATVPGAACHGCGLLSWQEERLPVLDLNVLLHPGTSAEAVYAPRYALVLAYQRAPRAPLEYGAIVLDRLPLTIAVGDEAQCELPDDCELLPQLALSCFRHDGQAVPVLDTTRLFCARPA
jgi:chemotaxis signal transduction protein